MTQKIILDTGPLAAYIDKGDRFHDLMSGSSVLSLDRDFRIYRKNKNEAIALIISDELWKELWLLVFGFLFGGIAFHSSKGRTKASLGQEKIL